jgi:hypothetical protein
MIRKALTRLKTDNENGARKAVIEDLFYDFHRSKKEIYYMNFVRGVFFGIGSILGGTIFIALILWLLSFLVDIPGGVGDFIQYIVDTVHQSRKV